MHSAISVEHFERAHASKKLF